MIVQQTTRIKFYFLFFFSPENPMINKKISFMSYIGVSSPLPFQNAAHRQLSAFSIRFNLILFRQAIFFSFRFDYFSTNHQEYKETSYL